MWIEILKFEASELWQKGSSPCRDVNWNGIKATNDPDYSVHPLAGMWIEISSKDEEDNEENKNNKEGKGKDK